MVLFKFNGYNLDNIVRNLWESCIELINWVVFIEFDNCERWWSFSQKDGTSKIFFLYSCFLVWVAWTSYFLPNAFNAGKCLKKLPMLLIGSKTYGLTLRISNNSFQLLIVSNYVFSDNINKKFVVYCIRDFHVYNMKYDWYNHQLASYQNARYLGDLLLSNY